MSRYINKFWVAFTIILFTALFIILVPMMVNKYGLLGALLWSPLFVIAAVLAYIRGYWVSKWMSGDKHNEVNNSKTAG